MSNTAKLDGILFPNTPFDVRKSLIFLGRRGSEAQGLYIPPTEPDSIDDRDLYGICVPPAEYYCGFQSWNSAADIRGEWDVVLHEVRRFAGLVLSQNPNVLSMLWLDEEDELFVSDEWRRLKAFRTQLQFRSRAYESFLGYARSQLKKMELSAGTTAKSYAAAYMGERRAALVEKHGYDTKNACHAIRILHMGVEYLRDGTLRVKRDWDRDFLKRIKGGMWTMQEVVDFARDRIDGLHAAYRESPLPEEDAAAVQFLERELVACVKARLA